MSNDAFYGRMQNVATDLLRRYGQGDIRLRRVVHAAPAPETPYRPGAGVTSLYRLDGTAGQVWRKFVDGTAILHSDGQATVSVRAQLVEQDGAPVPAAEIELEPAASDELLIDGRKVTVLAVRRVPEAGTAVSFALIYRG